LKRKYKRFQKNKAILGQAKHRRKRSSRVKLCYPTSTAVKTNRTTFDNVTKQRSKKQVSYAYKTDGSSAALTSDGVPKAIDSAVKERKKH
jgi:hypothetical protein